MIATMATYRDTTVMATTRSATTNSGITAVRPTNKRRYKRFRVYLAGPLQGYSLVEALRWRRLLTEELAKHDIDGVSPPDIEAYTISGESPCLADLKVVRSCNVLYSNLTGLSAGTIIEMYVAKYQYKMPVVTRCRIADPSPFIEFCTTTFVRSRGNAIKELIQLKNGKVSLKEDPDV